MDTGDFTGAHEWFTRALDLQRGLNTPWMAASLNRLGDLAVRQGEYAQARAYLNESIVLMRAHGLPTAPFHWPLVRLGLLAVQRGEYAEAQEWLINALHDLSAGGVTRGAVYAIEGLASLAVAQGRLVRATRLFAWAAHMRPALDYARIADLDQARIDRDIGVIQTQLDEATIEVAQAEGRRMSYVQALAYAEAD